MYQGHADWDVLNGWRMPHDSIDGNGDVQTPQDAARIDEVGADAVMIGG